MVECRLQRVVSSLALLVSLAALPGPGQAAELKEAVEQLAAQLTKSVREGYAWWGRLLRVAVTDFPDLQGVTGNLGRYASPSHQLAAQAQKFRVIERRWLGQVLGELPR